MDTAEAIKEQVGIYQVLRYYRIEFMGGGEPEQISCPFHGADINKSARIYPENESVYCFVCDKVFDVIGFVQEKEEIPFGEACRLLKTSFNVVVSMPDYEARFYTMKKKPSQDIYDFSDAVERLFIAFAQGLTQEEFYARLTLYNECLAKKDDILLKPYITTKELERWYEESKIKLGVTYG